jgi:hypothetical protein
MLNSFAHTRKSDYAIETRAVHATLWAESSPKVSENNPQLLFIVHDVTQTSWPIDSYCGLLVHVCVCDLHWPVSDSLIEKQDYRAVRDSTLRADETPRAYIQWYIWLWMLALKSEYSWSGPQVIAAFILGVNPAPYLLNMGRTSDKWILAPCDKQRWSLWGWI